MKDPETSLAELTNNRGHARIEAGWAQSPILHPALEIALKYRWRVAPINGHSQRSFYCDRVGSPSRDPGQIELWVDTWVNLNWALEIGASSGVAALEIDLDLAKPALVELTNDGWRWRRSLRFAVGSRWFVLFRYSAGIRSLKGVSGVRVCTDSILIPPSHTPSGIEITYADPYAPLLFVPSWLKEGPFPE
jgi:hypothetical protein